MKSACRHFLTWFFMPQYFYISILVHILAVKMPSWPSLTTFIYISWDTDQCLHSHWESSHIAAHLHKVKLVNAYEKLSDSLLLLFSFSPIPLKTLLGQITGLWEMIRVLRVTLKLNITNGCKGSTCSWFLLNHVILRLTKQSVSLYIHGPIGDVTT